MKIGIVGCGTISRHHLAAAARYRGATVVGVADVNLACARAQAGRFGVPHAFATLTDLLNLSPDVIHVLTPPATHERLTCEALAAGAHGCALGARGLLRRRRHQEGCPAAAIFPDAGLGVSWLSLLGHWRRSAAAHFPL